MLWSSTVGRIPQVDYCWRATPRNDFQTTKDTNMIPVPGVPIALRSPFVALHPGFTTTEEVELTAFLLIGLLGGAHCLGMCGPLVTMYARRFGASGAGDARSALTFGEIRQHLLFNLGRTVSYAILGGLFGVAGAFFFDAASVVLVFSGTVRAATGTLVGLVIVITGLGYLTGNYGGHGIRTGLPVAGRLAGLFGRLQARFDGLVDGPGIFGLGLVHGVLPCPLLFPAYLYVFVRGSPLLGIVGLGLLGLGTIPTLFVYGTVVGSVGPKHRERLHRALGVAFIVLGLMPLAHGLSLVGIEIPHVEPPVYQPLSE